MRISDIKKFSRIISIKALLIVFPLLFLVGGVGIFLFLYASEDPGIKNVRISNVTPTSVTIMWETDYPTKGRVVALNKNESPNIFTKFFGDYKISYDDRAVEEVFDQSTQSTTRIYRAEKDYDKKIHHVTIKNLDANRKYAFVIDGTFKFFENESLQNIELKDVSVSSVPKIRTVYGGAKSEYFEKFSGGVYRNYSGVVVASSMNPEVDGIVSTTINSDGNFSIELQEIGSKENKFFINAFTDQGDGRAVIDLNMNNNSSLEVLYIDELILKSENYDAKNLKDIQVGSGCNGVKCSCTVPGTCTTWDELKGYSGCNDYCRAKNEREESNQLGKVNELFEYPSTDTPLVMPENLGSPTCIDFSRSSTFKSAGDFCDYPRCGQAACDGNGPLGCQVCPKGTLKESRSVCSANSGENLIGDCGGLVNNQNNNQQTTPNEFYKEATKLCQESCPNDNSYNRCLIDCANNPNFNCKFRISDEPNSSSGLICVEASQEWCNVNRARSFRSYELCQGWLLNNTSEYFDSFSNCVSIRLAAPPPELSSPKMRRFFDSQEQCLAQLHICYELGTSACKIVRRSEDEKAKFGCSNSCEFNYLNVPLTPSLDQDGTEEMLDRNVNIYQLNVNNAFSKLSAQSAPTPEVVNPAQLERGVYMLFVPGYNSAEFTILGNSVSVTYFEDANANGIKDEGEKVVDLNTYDIKISKVKEIQNYELSLGWNLITLNVYDENIDTAKKLIEYVRSQDVYIEQISKFDSGNWIHFIQTKKDNVFSDYGNDFRLIPGEGYFVRVISPGSVNVIGNKFESSVPVPLETGWNLIGVQSPTKYTANQILDVCKSQKASCVNISRFDQGVYDSVAIDEGIFFGNNFEIKDIEGYFVLNEGKETVVRW